MRGHGNTPAVTWMPGPRTTTSKPVPGSSTDCMRRVVEVLNIQVWLSGTLALGSKKGGKHFLAFHGLSRTRVSRQARARHCTR